MTSARDDQMRQSRFFVHNDRRAWPDEHPGQRDTPMLHIVCIRALLSLLRQVGQDSCNDDVAVPECWFSRPQTRQTRQPPKEILPIFLHRSKMRPAFTANCGSRGKIQDRYRQGRMASSCSHRHIVLSLIVATRPD